jgi:serine/threonine-protein kinase
LPTPPRPTSPARKELPILAANRVGELTGHVLAHFQVGPMIAKGRTGMVFQAVDLNSKQPVALKVFWPEFARHEVEVRRFIRAMRTMMPLRHPNLVSVLGAGKKSVYCWVAMELVGGESLHELIGRKGSAGMLDWRHAFRIAQHVGQALDFAHCRKIIHRNVTPRNVLIRTEDRNTLLGDLMLARALEGTLAQEVTQPGEMLGDVRYVSPERTKGTEEIDGRSDLYSLGALLYTLLAGQPPFEGYTIAETVMQIRQKKPEPPKKFQLAIPDRFQDVVLTLLAKRPESRYQTARALLEDLARIAKFHDVRV